MTFKSIRNGLAPALILIAVAFGAQATQKVPINNFFTHNKNIQPRLSPSGRYLSVVTWDPKVQKRNWLTIYDLKDQSIKDTLSLRQVRTFSQEIFWNVYWLTDDHLVFESAVNYGALGKPSLTGKIYSIDLADDDLRLLQGPWSGNRQGFHVIRRLRDDPDHIITVGNSMTSRRSRAVSQRSPSAFMLKTHGSADHDAAVKWGKGRTANGHRIMTSPLPNGGLSADRDGNIRLAYGTDPDTGKSLAVYRKSVEADWQPVPESFYDQRGETVLGLSSDGSDVYTLHYEPDDGTLGLYRIDGQTGDSTKLYDNPRAGIDSTYSHNGVIWGPKAEHIAAVETMYGLPKLSLLRRDGPVAKILSAFSQSFKGQYPRIVSWSRDGSRAIVDVSSDRNPGKYYLVNSKSMHAEPLFNKSPDINPEDMASMRPIQFKARDGMVIHGYLTLPKDTPADPPMVVYVHGGPHGVRDHWRFDPMVQLLANRGYAVLQINYRGSMGYGWDYTRAGFHHWGTSMQYDLIDGTQWAIKRGYADADRVCIFGASYGGYAALRSAEIAPDLYQCTVGYDGVYDLNLMTENLNKTASGANYARLVFPEDRAKRASQSPVNHVRRLEGGIFLIHGGADYTAPIEHVKRLMKALDAAGKDYEYLYKAHEGHGFGKIANKRELGRKLLDFFHTWIGA